MYHELRKICTKPRPYACYTAADLWTDPHISRKMLQFHLAPKIDAASRNHHFIDRSARWITGRFNLGPASRVIDFGCGPGLYTIRLAQSGARVTGLDFSSSTIAYARKEAERAKHDITYINTDYLTYEADGKYDLITMIMCDFCVLSPVQRKKLLSSFRTMLAPGGSILLDLYSNSHFEAASDAAEYGYNYMDGFWAPNEYFCFKTTFTYQDEKLILDLYTIYEPDRKLTVYNWFQCFSIDALTQELNASGLSVVQLLGDVAGKPCDPQSREFAVVAGLKQ
ncbi:MAG: class I SAM-dependent methyltransferase [Spirochaetota bacterium]